MEIWAIQGLRFLVLKRKMAALELEDVALPYLQM